MSEQLYFVERGTGAPLVLIHGAMVSGEMFGAVIDRFAQRHRVIVPDLRGHGRSRGVPGPDDVATVAADLPPILDALGIARTAVLGYSQGGAVAQQFATDFPSRCERLVLACTYAFNMSTLREAIEGRAAPWLIRLFGMRRFGRFVASAGLGNRGDTLAALIAEQDPRRMISAWKAAMAFDGRSRLGAIHCPTLIVAGSADSAVPMHHTQMLEQGISGATVRIVEGAGHALLWTHPDEFLRVTEAFLATSQ